MTGNSTKAHEAISYCLHLYPTYAPALYQQAMLLRVLGRPTSGAKKEGGRKRGREGEREEEVRFARCETCGTDAG
eukprot:2193702-Rhodomonas_salina.1